MSRRVQHRAQKLAIEYNVNINLILELLEVIQVEEIHQLLQMKIQDLRTTARVNLLNHSRSEILKFLKLENIIAKPLSGIPEGIEIIKGSNKIGSSLSYLNGLVMPQGFGSMLAVHTLDPHPGEIILDMAAAPGGKSCFIGERLRGEGLLIANDISVKRMRSLFFNLTRHGIRNCRILNLDARKIVNVKPDRILLDAPCTGTGLLVSKPHVKSSKTLGDSIQLQKVQQNLLQNAYSLLSSNGVCVYSTCSLSSIENEMVVKSFEDRFLIEPIHDLDVLTNISGSRYGARLFPHIHKCDGFFISKLVKI